MERCECFFSQLDQPEPRVVGEFARIPAMPEDGELGIARAHATKVVPLARSDQSVGEVLATLPGRRFESADDIVVLEGSSLKGLVPIATLLAAAPQARIAGVMNADPPVVAPGADQEAVAWEMVRRGESSVAVVDAVGNFEGLVPPQRMVAVVMAEHDEDVARLAGYLASTQRLRLDHVPGRQLVVGPIQHLGDGLRISAPALGVAPVRRALATGDGAGAYAAATELPRVELADALALTLLLADDWKLYERACVRWVGRFALEVPGIPLASTHLALAALSSLGRGRTAGAHALAELFEELGRSDLTDAVEGWLEQR